MHKGIDTSKWQASKVNYAKAKQAGLEFAILRIGANGTKDKCFEADYASAKAAGLKIGVYHYSYATNESGAQIDANRVLGWLNGRKIDLPVFYDMEDEKQKGKSRRTLNTAMVNKFASLIKAAGYDCMLYTGEYFCNNYINVQDLTVELWIAKYSTKEPSVGHPVSLWQYSSDAINTDYFAGKLDQNYCYIDKWFGTQTAAIKAEEAAANPYPVPTRTLKKTVPCMKGNDVRWLQYELGIAVDGIFGNQTKAMVKDFQKSYGLTVDGIVGAVTRYKLINS